ncbi:MAG: hypothetical protein HY822_14285 [Acidobacteria bacterium]|nr:hypothetical protein [Acidobacteriota bacterium]
MSLEEVARYIQRSFGTKNVVVAGDPNLRVKMIGDEWLKPMVPEVPVRWISSGDPFEVPPIRIN